MIPKKVHCFFEQSGTFKNEFKKLGVLAYDYDIKNNFNQTDFVIDLFEEIEKGFAQEKSIFDDISKDDLIIAFFPCIYFSCLSQVSISWNCTNYRNLTPLQRGEKIIQRSKNREYYFALAVKMFSICSERGLKLIMENPWSEQTFLKNNFILSPSYVENNRSLRGDNFKKPTAYWALNFELGKQYTLTPNKNVKLVKKCKNSPVAGICSEERSMITPLYAYNFICDQI